MDSAVSSAPMAPATPMMPVSEQPPMVAPTYEGKAIVTTICSLNGWFKEMYERLGWVLLGAAEGMEHKMTHYRQGLADLDASIRMRMASLEENDRKTDLNIMLTKLKWLMDLVDSMDKSKLPVLGGAKKKASKKGKTARK